MDSFQHNSIEPSNLHGAGGPEVRQVLPRGSPVHSDPWTAAQPAVRTLTPSCTARLRRPRKLQVLLAKYDAGIHRLESIRALRTQPRRQPDFAALEEQAAQAVNRLGRRLMPRLKRNWEQHP